MQDRPVRKVSEGWITSLSLLAFVRAGFSLLLVLSGLVDSGVKFGSLEVGTRAIIDVAILAVLGVAAMKRLLWAGYGLIVYSAIDFLVKVAVGAIVSAVGGAFWVALFTVGTIHLFRSKQFASPIRLDFAFVFRWAVLVLFIGFLKGFILGMLKGLSGGQVSFGTFLGITVVSYALILGSQIIAARRKPIWSLEHILSIAIVATLLGSIVDLPFEGSVASTAGASLYLFIITFAAWGIALKLKPASQVPV